jgi:hypothetical protein
MLPNGISEDEEVVVIDVSPTGEITAIYDDQLCDVFESLGTLRRPRASEINEDPDTGLFVPDLTLSGGSQLPGRRLKREAEADEVAWLLRNRVGYQEGT